MNPVVRALLQGFNFVRYGRAYFDGVGDYLTLGDSGDWDFGSSDFAVECIMQRFSASGVTERICGQVNSTESGVTESFRLSIQPENTILGSIRSGTTPYSATSSGTITDTGDHHIALARNGNNLNLYIDGTLSGTAKVTGVTCNNSSNKFSIGRLGEYNGNYFKGHMKGIRVTKGEARYTSDFTPPLFFEVDSANVKLCMNFGEIIGATTFIDDTGKTVTTGGNVIIVA